MAYKITDGNETPYMWRPWVDEFLATKRPGERSAWLNDLVEGSEEFRAGWDAAENIDSFAEDTRSPWKDPDHVYIGNAAKDYAEWKEDLRKKKELVAS